MDYKDYYKILGVSKNASVKVCKLSHLGFGLVLMNANPNLALVGEFQVSILKELILKETIISF